MGCWSQPICVNPSNLKINCSVIPDKIIGQLAHCGYFEDKSETSMDKLHKQCYDTAKIWGYLNNNETTGWKDLCFIICKQNNINFIQLHFLLI